MTKVCARCKKTLPLDLFNKDKRRKDGATAQCKKCYAEFYKLRRRESYKRYRINSPEKALGRDRRHYRNVKKWKVLEKEYGITKVEYNELLLVQERRCAICRRPANQKINLHVDHNHFSNRVRGLLCTSCNLGVGALGDNVVTLARAVRYLEQV